MKRNVKIMALSFGVVLSLSSCLSLQSYAAEKDAETTTGKTALDEVVDSLRSSGTETAVQPELSDNPNACIAVSSTKKIVQSYTSAEEVPESFFYEEFNEGYGVWMSGTMTLQKTEHVGSLWTATYKGTLHGAL